MPDSEKEKAATKELLKLRRLPENRRCVNCLKEDDVGFKNIVVPFKTFVCSVCKSAHQSFSHHCKTSDMSTWTMEQVKALDDKNGGGNRLATERWMASMPDSERPASSDTSTLEALKKFVEKVYIEKRWESKDVPTPSKSPTPSGHSGSNAPTSVSGRDQTPTKRSKSKDEKRNRHEEDLSGNEKVKKEKKSKKDKKESKEEKRERGRGDQWGPTVSPHSTAASTTAGWSSDYPSLGSGYGTSGRTEENWVIPQGMLGVGQGMEQFNSNPSYAGYEYSGYAPPGGQSYSCHSTPRTQHSMSHPQPCGQLGNYGRQMTPPRACGQGGNYGGQVTPPQPCVQGGAYGGQLTPPQPCRQGGSYGGHTTPPQPCGQGNYGGQVTPRAQPILPQAMNASPRVPPVGAHSMNRSPREPVQQANLVAQCTPVAPYPAPQMTNTSGWGQAMSSAHCTPQSQQLPVPQTSRDIQHNTGICTPPLACQPSVPEANRDIQHGTDASGWGQAMPGGHCTPSQQPPLPQASNCVQHNTGGYCTPPPSQLQAPNVNRDIQHGTDTPGWGQAMPGGPYTQAQPSQFSAPPRDLQNRTGYHSTPRGLKPVTQTGPAFLGCGQAVSSASNAPCFRDPISRAGHAPPDGLKEPLPSHIPTSNAPEMFSSSGGNSVRGDYRASPPPSMFRNLSHGQPPKSEPLHPWRQQTLPATSPALPQRSATVSSLHPSRQRSLPPPPKAPHSLSPFSRPPSEADSRGHQGNTKEPLTLHSTNPWAADLGAKIIPVSTTSVRAESGQASQASAESCGSQQTKTHQQARAPEMPPELHERTELHQSSLRPAYRTGCARAQADTWVC